MGALIMTKGTKRLAAHYNDEFDTWLTFYRNNIAVFARGGRDIDIWTDIIQVVKDPRPGIGHTERADNLTLLPKDNIVHQNLHARWKFFLKNVLTQPNRNKLADAIHTVLGGNFGYIVFDVVVGAAQDVVLDTAKTDEGAPFAMITIVVTGHMAIVGVDANDPPPLDGPPAPYGSRP